MTVGGWTVGHVFGPILAHGYANLSQDGLRRREQKVRFYVGWAWSVLVQFSAICLCKSVNAGSIPTRASIILDNKFIISEGDRVFRTLTFSLAPAHERGKRGSGRWGLPHGVTHCVSYAETGCTKRAPPNQLPEPIDKTRRAKAREQQFYRAHAHSA